MKLIKYPILLLIITLLINISCSTTDDSRIPEVEKAANVRILLDPDYSSLRADDIPNAKIVFSVFSENKNINQVQLVVQYYNFATDSLYSRRVIESYSQNDFDASDGAIRNITLTSGDLAQAFGLSSINDLGGGDRFDFFNITRLTNGLVFPDTIPVQGGVLNVPPAITQTSATTSFTSQFTVYVACPFIASESEGTYEVVNDGWGDWNPGEQLDVIANADGTGVIVKGMYSKFRNDDRGPYDVEIVITDPNTGLATVAQQPAWEYYWYTGQEGYGTGSVAGSGFVFSCSGIITLTLEHTVAAGSFGSYSLTLKKI